MIKVPATLAGIDAIRRLTAEGVNVNATLLTARVRRCRAFVCKSDKSFIGAGHNDSDIHTS